MLMSDHALNRQSTYPRRVIRASGAMLLALLLAPAYAGGLDQVPASGRGLTARAGPVQIPTNLGSSDIKGWYAPNSRTLIVNTYDHGKYRATFRSPCHGIRSADTIGFSTQGRIELDNSTTVVLPDGSRCRLEKLNSYKAGGNH